MRRNEVERFARCSFLHHDTLVPKRGSHARRSHPERTDHTHRAFDALMLRPGPPASALAPALASAPASAPTPARAVAQDNMNRDYDYDCSIFDCPVCLKTLQDPVRACHSGHVYCKDCLEKHVETNGDKARCPECRDDLERVGEQIGAPFPLMNQIIQSKRSNCPFGCGHVGLLRDMNTHKQECALATVECPFASIGCTWSGRRCDAHRHAHMAVSDHLELQVKWQHDQRANNYLAWRKCNVGMANIYNSIAEVKTAVDAIPERTSHDSTVVHEKLDAIGGALDALIRHAASGTGKRKAEGDQMLKEARLKLNCAFPRTPKASQSRATGPEVANPPAAPAGARHVARRVRPLEMAPQSDSRSGPTWVTWDNPPRTPSPPLDLD